MSVNINTIKEQSKDLIQPMGMLLMTAATVFGMVEVPDHIGRAVLPSQPILAVAGQNGDDNSPMRREKDEVSTHYISYGVTQRTPSRTGRQ